MFDSPSISDYYRQLQEALRSEILRESDEQIIGSDPEELARYYYEKFAISPIVEDPEAKPNVDIQNYLQDVPPERREDFYRNMGPFRDMPSQRAIVELPILPNKDLTTLSHLHGATYSLSYSDKDFNWRERTVSATIETKGYQFEMDSSQIKRETNEALKRMRDTIAWKNVSIEQGNRELLVYIKNLLSERKQKIVKDKEKLAELTKTINIPLKKKQIVGAHQVRVAHTPLVQRLKPKPTLPEQYVLEETRVNDIVTLLDNQARSFEQTPKAFKELGEEDLRDILLSNLNSVFEGGATGETFSKNGKTDIYLRIAKGNILIAECKIWAGKTLYDQTINQLRSYLTWRHNYGIMLTFVRIKDFTKVLRECQSVIKGHTSYINGFRESSNTHFISNHHVDDREKEVRMHHLFYHLYY